jgi:hypothetical protein
MLLIPVMTWVSMSFVYSVYVTPDALHSSGMVCVRWTHLCSHPWPQFPVEPGCGGLFDTDRPHSCCGDNRREIC